MVEIDLPDKLVDVIGEDVFPPDLGFGTITGDARSCRTDWADLAWV
jgi:hypothetical protein